MGLKQQYTPFGDRATNRAPVRDTPNPFPFYGDRSTTRAPLRDTPEPFPFYGERATNRAPVRDGPGSNPYLAQQNAEAAERERLRLQELDPAFQRNKLRGDMATIAAQQGIPPELVSLWVDAWVETGDAQIALARVRGNQAVYDSYFPGNRRDDGTFRYSESQYRQVTDAFADVLGQFGLNPDVFSSKFVDLIKGDVSPNEFKGRVEALDEGIGQRGEEIRQAYAEASGGMDFDRTSILAGLLDPDGVGESLLRRDISVAQVRGTASKFGFNRSVARGRELVGGGIGEAAATDFYSQAGQRVGFLDEAARRFSEADDTFDLAELEDASLFRDEEQRQRAQRLIGRSVGEFGRQIGVRSEGGAAVGLRDR